jgi:hypothetical protein
VAWRALGVLAVLAVVIGLAGPGLPETQVQRTGPRRRDRRADGSQPQHGRTDAADRLAHRSIR